MLPPKATLLSFDAVADAPGACGIYEIVTADGIALKIGIARSLRRRLRAHGRSSQSRLRLRQDGSWASPSDVSSKQSVLAKHLYFDFDIASQYDLTTEDGRQRFLREQCQVRFIITESRDEARSIERELERTGQYRYCGRVQIRPTPPPPRTPGHNPPPNGTARPGRPRYKSPRHGSARGQSARRSLTARKWCSSAR